MSGKNKKKSQPDKSSGESIVARNRKARFLYEILETYEAGLELHGTEVKSLRDGSASITEAFAMPKSGEMWIHSMRISPYEMGNRFNHVPERPRKLLLHRREIERMSGLVAQKGLTLVPLRVYFKNRRAKIEIGVCRGKKVHDKRESIKERDMKRSSERSYKIR